jgi:hypothetical protein
MSITNTFLTGYPSPATKIDVERMAKQGVHAVFRAQPIATTPDILSQMERRERIVLLLLDGKRTLQDVAKLVHRSELEIAWTLVRLLERGYIEFLET